jgi:hypothetical protein
MLYSLAIRKVQELNGTLVYADNDNILYENINTVKKKT